jgi:hypothetical protein
MIWKLIIEKTDNMQTIPLKTFSGLDNNLPSFAEQMRLSNYNYLTINRIYYEHIQ